MVFAVWAAPEPVAPTGSPSSRTRSCRRCAWRAPEPEQLAHEASERYGYPRRLPRALLREAPLPLRPARARRPVHVPRARPRRGRARRACPSCASSSARPVGRRERCRRRRVLEKALDGERISDDEALALLRSRDLVAVGRAANELRSRKADPDRDHVHRRPEPQLHEHLLHRLRLLRLLPPPRRRARATCSRSRSSSRRSRRRSRSAAPALLMQGGHHPDLGIDYYEDLFRSIKARYPIHLHALSPPEVQHIARRSKLTTLGDALAPARRRPRLDPGRRRRDPRRPRARRDRAEEDEVARSGSTSCARRTGSACRRRRR